MNNGGKLTGCLAVSAILAGVMTSGAVSPTAVGTEYQRIPLRNIFNIQDEPPPPEPVKQKVPPPNVKLIGVGKWNAQPQAILWVQEAGPPPKPPTTAVLKEGMRTGPVQVLDIDVASKTARVQIDADVMVLKLEDKPVGGPIAPAAVAAAAPRPVYTPGVPSGMRGNASARAVAFPNSAIPPIPTSANPAISPSINPGGMPSRTMRTDDNSSQPMSVEEQIVRMEQQRDALLKAKSPVANLLPQTILTPSLQPGLANPALPTPPSPGR